jgi:hypothetical protein
MHRSFATHEENASVHHHASRNDANCDWVVTPSHLYVTVIRPIAIGEE